MKLQELPIIPRQAHGRIAVNRVAWEHLDGYRRPMGKDMNVSGCRGREKKEERERKRGGKGRDKGGRRGGGGGGNNFEHILCEFRKFRACKKHLADRPMYANSGAYHEVLPHRA